MYPGATWGNGKSRVGSASGSPSMQLCERLSASCVAPDARHSRHLLVRGISRRIVRSSTTTVLQAPRASSGVLANSPNFSVCSLQAHSSQQQKESISKRRQANPVARRPKPVPEPDTSDIDANFELSCTPKMQRVAERVAALWQCSRWACSVLEERIAYTWPDVSFNGNTLDHLDRPLSGCQLR